MLSFRARYISVVGCPPLCSFTCMIFNTRFKPQTGAAQPLSIVEHERTKVERKNGIIILLVGTL